MKCMVCGKPLTDYALIGKKNDMKVAFCAEHIPDCNICDECDLRCMKCGRETVLRASPGIKQKERWYERSNKGGGGFRHDSAGGRGPCGNGLFCRCGRHASEYSCEHGHA